MSETSRELSEEIEKAVRQIGRKVCIGECDAVDTDAAGRILRDFARKVQAIERERCAKVADALAVLHSEDGPEPWAGAGIGALKVAAAIRASK